ncbi:glycosyltransferase [Crocosphaera sp. UHCC 0190]|uniref:glycosyltransferase n=1 Tax=Crocosphaera sp. UHCC 0190 TaxID=3110246 RepID=UPI002B2029E3|nr:glycosyltransferase [Crocosphaera sp. UHCC 0190]MEA5511026.1 glycosyltransferase [Crocosphaera sp. UHCC 0190]
MENLSLDLVICTYNNALLLDRVLGAIREQVVSPKIKWGVLVVNNNCTDETVEIVEKYQKTAKFTLRMVIELIQGLTPARLCGVKNTSGEWIAFVDDDCLLAPDWVEQAAIFAKSQPKCGGFGGKVILDWQIQPSDEIIKFGYCYAEQNHGEEVQTVPCIVGAGMVIRRTALEDVGWIDKQLLADRVGKKLISGGDVEIGLRLASKYDLWYNPACQLQHLIPEYRISLDYLHKMNIGLGGSKLFGDSLLWGKSYPLWLMTSIAYGIREGLKLITWTLHNLRWGKSLTEVSLYGSFLKGWWLGLWQLFWLNPQERQALLGCAKVS